MQISEAGIEKLEVLEGGFQAHPYKDSGGVLTVGFGHALREGISKAAAQFILREDVKVAEDAIARHVRVPLTQNQFDALCLFVFNEGEGHFAESTLLRLLNDGHYDAVPGELRNWVYDNHVKVQGLVNRRNAEVAIWNTCQES